MPRSSHKKNARPRRTLNLCWGDPDAGGDKQAALTDSSTAICQHPEAADADDIDVCGGDIVDTAWIKEEPPDEDMYVVTHIDEEIEPVLIGKKRKRNDIKDEGPQNDEPLLKDVKVKLEPVDSEEEKNADPLELTEGTVKDEMFEVTYETEDGEEDEDDEENGWAEVDEPKSSRLVCSMQKCSKCAIIFPYIPNALPSALQKFCKNCKPNVSISCKFCGQHFEHHKLYKKHMKECALNKYICPHCQKGFQHENKLRTHKCLAPSMGRLPRFICPICCEGFVKAKERNNHKRLHVQSRPIKCKHCKTQVRDLDALQEHLDSHSIRRLFICTTCGLAFYLKGIFDTDQTNHRQARGDFEMKRPPDFVYICTVCQKWFEKLSKCENHKCTGRRKVVTLNNAVERHLDFGTRSQTAENIHVPVASSSQLSLPTNTQPQKQLQEQPEEQLQEQPEEQLQVQLQELPHEQTPEQPRRRSQRKSFKKGVLRIQRSLASPEREERGTGERVIRERAKGGNRKPRKLETKMRKRVFRKSPRKNKSRHKQWYPPSRQKALPPTGGDSNQAEETATMQNGAIVCHFCHKYFKSTKLLAYHDCLFHYSFIDQGLDSDGEDDEVMTVMESSRIAQDHHIDLRAVRKECMESIARDRPKILGYSDVKNQPEPHCKKPCVVAHTKITASQVNMCIMCSTYLTHNFEPIIGNTSAEYLCSKCVVRASQNGKCTFKCSKCFQVFDTFHGLQAHVPWHEKEPHKEGVFKVPRISLPLRPRDDPASKAGSVTSSAGAPDSDKNSPLQSKSMLTTLLSEPLWTLPGAAPGAGAVLTYMSMPPKASQGDTVQPKVPEKSLNIKTVQTPTLTALPISNGKQQQQDASASVMPQKTGANQVQPVLTGLIQNKPITLNTNKEVGASGQDKAVTTRSSPLFLVPLGPPAGREVLFMKNAQNKLVKVPLRNQEKTKQASLAVAQTKAQTVTILPTQGSTVSIPGTQTPQVMTVVSMASPTPTVLDSISTTAGTAVPWKNSILNVTAPITSSAQPSTVIQMQVPQSTASTCNPTQTFTLLPVQGVQGALGSGQGSGPAQPLTLFNTQSLATPSPGVRYNRPVTVVQMQQPMALCGNNKTTQSITLVTRKGTVSTLAQNIKFVPLDRPVPNAPVLPNTKAVNVVPMALSSTQFAMSAQQPLATPAVTPPVSLLAMGRAPTRGATHVSSGTGTEATKSPQQISLNGQVRDGALQISVSQTGASSAEVTVNSIAASNQTSNVASISSVPGAPASPKKGIAVGRGYFFCYSCGLIFKTTEELKTHGCAVQAFSCHLCNNKFKSPELLYSHKCQKQAFICHMCKKRCSSAKELNQHPCIETNDIRLTDGSTSVQEGSVQQTKDSSSMTSCSQLTKQQIRDQVLKRKQEQAEQRSLQHDALVKSVTEKKTDFTCSVCSISFPSRVSLYVHSNRHRLHKVGK